MRKAGKLFVLLCCLIAISVIVFGCAGQDKNVETELRVALPEDVRGFEPSTSGHTSGIWDIYSLLYDRIVIEDRNKEVIPQLAKSWEASENGLTWTFHLRDDVTFSNGAKFNAEAFKASLEYLGEKSVCPVPLTKKIKSIEVVDEYAVQLNLKAPHAPLIADLTDMRYPVLGFADNLVVGTGPYILKNWDKGKEIVLVKNEKYWKGTPKIDRIVFKVIPDPHTQLLALESGDIDLLRGIPNFQELQRLQKDPNITIDTIHNWKVGSHFIMNYKKGPLSDVKVRKAISHAIDTEKMRKDVVGKYGITGAAHLSPVSPFANPALKGYDYDPEKAKNYLAEAGWQDTNNDGIVDQNGKPLHINILITKGDKSAIAEIAQNQLQSIGLEVEIKVLELGAQHTAVKEGNYDLALFTSIYCSGADPHLHFRQLYHTGIDDRYNYLFKSELLDSLIEKLYTTLDKQGRIRVYQQIQEVLYENAAAVYLFYEDSATLYNKRLKNLDPYTGELNTLWQANFEQ